MARAPADRRPVRWATRGTRAAVSVAIALVLLSCQASPEPTDGAIAIVVTGGTLIDGTGGSPVTDGLVWIEEGRVTAAGPADDFTVPSSVRVIDVEGGTILPGFFDAHVHEAADPSLRRDFLVGGVTSVCALGSRLEDMDRYEVETHGDLMVARAFQAGPIVTAPGGAPDVALDIDYNLEVATPDEAKVAVTDLVDRGADFIKVYVLGPDSPFPVLDDDRVVAIVEAAHSAGVLVRAHVTDFSVLEMPVSAGVDVIDHLPWLSPTPEESQAILADDDPVGAVREMVAAIDATELWDRMVAGDIVMVPTLARAIAGKFPPELPPEPRQQLTDIYLDSVRGFHEAGGTIALGTDFNAGMSPGIPVAELEYLSDSGLTPMELVEASTRHAARVCGQGDTLGTLETGKIGDLIVVSGDPLSDLSALADVRLVVKDGAVAYRAP